jgi:hypothetical protein
VAEVRVHLDDDAGAAGQGDREAVEVRPSQALLGGPMPDADARIDRREFVGDAAGPVGR